MKDKLEPFFDEIVRRKSVAYAAFTSYFLVFVPLLIRASEVFIYNLMGEYINFFSRDFILTGTFFLQGLLFTSVPALTLFLFLILSIPTYILYRKEKNSDFRLKHRPIYESPLYKGVLAFGCLLFCLLLIALPIADIAFFYFVGYNSSGEYFDISECHDWIFLSPFALGAFLYFYILYGLSSIFLAICKFFGLLFNFHV